MSDNYKIAAEAREAALCEPCRGIQRDWRRAPGHAELVQGENRKEDRDGHSVTVTRYRCARCASIWDYEQQVQPTGGLVAAPPMKAPPRLESLLEEGLIDTVVRQLMSGKEAMVFVVRSGEHTLCAKIYKEANNRSFRQAVDYTENRKVKNSRSARAMAKGSKFGRQEQEAAWQSAEVDALYRLAAAGVRVPQPYNFHDGVLLMELVTDAHGDAAPG